MPKNADPYTITLDEAVALLQQKKQADEPLHVFGDIQVLNGRFGAYIKTPQGNYRIPKSTDLQALTEAACRELIEKSEPTSATKKRFTRKK
jgi:DNA topoisomerase-1